MFILAYLLHPTDRIDWLRWSIHPSTVIGIAALGALYWWRCRMERRVPTAGQRLSFAAGLVVLFASLNGPIHDLSDYYLFSAHMVQHLLLTMLVTPLLLGGTPEWMLAPALRSPAVAAGARRLTTPIACFLIFNTVLIAWHLPPLYNAAMANHGVHIVQHLTLLVASTLMWWPLMSPLSELPRISYPKQMLYTFLLTLPMSTVSIAITYADHVLYPAYAAAPRLLPLSPLEDQRLGGLIMWIPGGFIFLAVLTVVFFKWASAGGDEAVSGEAARA
ncbi:MAG TPA: cytochrome c oxidase assembly protein [Gemmatimonadaceae bacterium]|nr:cytochrome c oxidase assembly protein [Gemmatimonadaceae bacterium]